MSTLRNKTLPIVVLALLAAGVAWSATRPAPAPAPPVPADTLAGQVKLLWAQPFVLDEPWTHWYRAEQPVFTAGVLAVVSVDDLALVQPHQGYEPVLYAGAQTAERINVGDRSGRLVIVVPGPLGADGAVDVDLSAGPIFFGEPALPEQVDAAIVQRELDRAVAAGVPAPTAEEVAAVSRESVRLPDMGELRAYAADLVEQYSPQETDLVAGLRAPRLPR